MGKEKKKGKSGTAITYINRTQALKKLQLSLSDFRKLCILKGIYPHDPKHRHKLDKGKDMRQLATYYLLKDIQYLSHEPLIDKFRDFKIFANKLKKLRAKKEYMKADQVLNAKPKFTYDHIIKERYPNFEDALGDLDDCLTLCTLFSKLPKSQLIRTEMITNCRRLIIEFLYLIMITKSLRKVFLSIKGIYYQAEILGNHVITWITPYDFYQNSTSEVDFKIMSTYTDFYMNLLGFVNYKLYTDNNLVYPPKFVNTFASNSIDSQISMFGSGSDGFVERLASFNEDLYKINQDVVGLSIDAENEIIEKELFDELPDEFQAQNSEIPTRNKLIDLFKGLKFFLNREVPRESLTFVIRSFGGQVSWPESVAVGSSYPETDETITHQIVDRTFTNQHHLQHATGTDKFYLKRFYIQPQWVYDCVNAQKIVDVQAYFATVSELPAHTSPFYSNSMLVGLPMSRDDIELSGGEDEDINAGDEEESSLKEEARKKRSKDEIVARKLLKKQKVMRSEPGKKHTVDNITAKAPEKEEIKLREMMLSKKYKRLYHKMNRVEKYRKKDEKRLNDKRKKFYSSKE